MLTTVALLVASLLLFCDIDVVGWTVGIFIAGLISIYLLAWAWARYAFSRPLRGTVAFFHPYADGGGGGERVLWAAVQAIQKSHPSIAIVIYCGQGSTPASLCHHAASRFNLKIDPSFTVIELPSRDALDPKRYPRFTMIGQALGSIRVAIQGLKKLVPEVWIDTTGWAFPYPIVRLTGSHVVAYVHYPTISTDMLEGVRARQAEYNNDDDIAASWVKSLVKLLYYQVFAGFYGIVGTTAQVVMVNSNWTREHIEALWRHRRPPMVVYPPCDTSDLRTLSLDRKLKRLYVLSVAQFRPEKNHELQLRALAAAREKALHLKDGAVADAVLSARLQLVGGCRGPEDEARLESLKQLAHELNLDNHVDFRVNVSFQELRALLGDAVAGIHTMRDEHFGISVVEYMAAGVVPVVHDSGGPKEDIVIPEISSHTFSNGMDGSSFNSTQPLGYRCTTVTDYAEALIEVLGMDQAQRLKIAAAARKKALSFSDERFQSEFLSCVEGILPK